MNPPSSRHQHQHRRDFVRTLTFGLSAAALPSDTTAADEPVKDASPLPSPETEAEARMALVLARFGKHLDANARDAVRAEVESITRRAESLRKFPLSNGDGPFPAFTPFRGRLIED